MLFSLSAFYYESTLQSYPAVDFKLLIARNGWSGCPPRLHQHLASRGSSANVHCLESPEETASYPTPRTRSRPFPFSTVPSRLGSRTLGHLKRYLSVKFWELLYWNLKLATQYHNLIWSMSCWGFSGSSDGKESAHNVGDPGSIPGWKDSLEKGMATHSGILIFWYLPWCYLSHPRPLASRRDHHLQAYIWAACWEIAYLQEGLFIPVFCMFRILWTEELGGLQATASQSQTRLSDFTFTFCMFGLPLWLS